MRSPGLTEVTAGPTATTTPDASWPSTVGSSSVLSFAAHSFQSYTLVSPTQTAQYSTLNRTSSGRLISGIGMSTNVRPGSGRTFISAFMG